MGDILNLKATIGRGGRDEKIEDSFGIIYEGIRMSNHIARQIAYWIYRLKKVRTR